MNSKNLIYNEINKMIDIKKNNNNYSIYNNYK